MTPPTERYDIPTGYGTVRVYRWANEENAAATPALFLPGHGSGAPMLKPWAAANEHTVEPSHPRLHGIKYS